MQNEELRIKLELPVSHVNVILTSLGKMPLENVISTFTEIQRQASMQMQQERPQAPLSSKVISD